MSVPFIEPEMLRELLLSDVEHAVLDAREEGEFGASHLFWAVPCPLSQMEFRVPRLLPSRKTTVVCVDDEGGLAETLAHYLIRLGYETVLVLRGGIRAWNDAGFVLFSGVNVPSKAFGEWVEHHFATESIDANQLNDWLESGRKIVVLDSRPFDEFERMSIPTGINLPGGELVYRIGDLVPDPDTLVVVNCAGRTRSILGAESLRRAGIPNRVVALRNGTMGWQLAGFKTACGQISRFSPGRPETESLATQRAKRFADSAGVKEVKASDIAAIKNGSDATYYLLDVRDPSEFLKAHYPGSFNAPGGQLVQETDQWVGVRNAQIVLIDNDGVRGRMTGAWLRLMGHRFVSVIDGELPMTQINANTCCLELLPEVEEITADELAMSEGVVIIDLAQSIQFRNAHIPGAIWGLRTRLHQISQLRQAMDVVATSPDGCLAQYATNELERLVTGRVRTLQGGTQAWIAAGLQTEASPFNPDDDECIDVYLRPFDRNHHVTEAMQEYLLWEVDLLKEIERDGTVHFGANADTDLLP